MKRFLIVCAGLILFQTESALALTGNELKAHLGSEVGLNNGIAYGYVEGVTHTRAREVCLPSGVSKGQMIDIVKNYLNAHPEFCISKQLISSSFALPKHGHANST